MLLALAGPDGNPRRRLVIVGDRLFRHWNEEVERRHDGLQIRDYRAVHHILQSCNCFISSTLEEAMLTVNPDRELSLRGRTGDIAARPPLAEANYATRREAVC